MMTRRGPVSPGTCRYCDCTDDTPCSCPPTGEPCAWADETRNRCTAPACIKAYDAERNAIRAYGVRMERERRERLGVRRCPRRVVRRPAKGGNA